MVSYYHSEPRVSINQTVVAYVLETYGITVSQQYVSEVRRICKREADGPPCDKRYSAVKMDYIKEALVVLDVFPCVACETLIEGDKQLSAVEAVRRIAYSRILVQALDHESEKLIRYGVFEFAVK